ncbi:MAG: hypothetical protein Metus_0658 [Candidatus Methanosuratincola subterraneus]|uniref:Uncharacterized protein n=1 Tax=Methanosuratincola subterraneus TaxID=2593994 RepID=A0A3S4UHE9_METS7|nr:MAG: hypothetical protein Metus_0658 [Candidatus Methanosuratincola subterraneus]
MSAFWGLNYRFIVLEKPVKASLPRFEGLFILCQSAQKSKLKGSRSVVFSG